MLKKILKTISSRLLYLILGLALALTVFVAKAAWSDRVTPGQTLTATLWNDLVAQVESLTNRIGALEAGAGSQSGIRITSLTGTKTGNSDFTYTGSSTPLYLTALIRTWGGGNCEGGVDARWLGTSGTVIKDWVKLSGTNLGSGNDGGSGMGDGDLATIPFVDNSTKIEFRPTGCWGYNMDLIAIAETSGGGGGGGGGMYRTQKASAGTSCETRCGGAGKCILADISHSSYQPESYPLTCSWSNSAYESECVCTF